MNERGLKLRGRDKLNEIIAYVKQLEDWDASLLKIVNINKSKIKNLEIKTYYVTEKLFMIMFETKSIAMKSGLIFINRLIKKGKHIS